MKKQDMYLEHEVTNLGRHAIVWGFHEITGAPILRDADGNKWLADVAKCGLAAPAAQGWPSGDGLTARRGAQALLRAYEKIIQT